MTRKPLAYYNENDPAAAAWLRELITAGLIAPGDVDERSICDVQGSDLAGYSQVHLFAGIGGWSKAMRLGGWPDDRPVWTGSCPCQPFSAAGKRKGTDDARHLWPEMFRLIRECRPAIAIGEQVASADGRNWLAGVRVDLETLDYAVGAADLCAAGAGEEGEGWILRGDRLGRESIVIGPPHIRQRLWWLADAENISRRNGIAQGGIGDSPDDSRRQKVSDGPAGCGLSGRLADSECSGVRLSGRGTNGATPGGMQSSDGKRERLRSDAGTSGNAADRLADAWRIERRAGISERARLQAIDSCGMGNAGGFWTHFDLIPCRDGKNRRIEPGSQPLAHGIRARVGRLRGYGNAINPQVAAQFITAYLECREAVSA